MRPERIPLFPLNVVLLPGAELPLHIFEPRYRQMVKDCLEEKSEFGMILSLDKGVARVGCTAEIMQVKTLRQRQNGHPYCRPRSIPRRGTLHRGPSAGRPRGLPGRPA